jgi:hypothetical protein
MELGSGGSMSASLHKQHRRCCANLHKTETILMPLDVFGSHFSPFDLNAD